jgi:hypothetical protein
MPASEMWYQKEIRDLGLCFRVQNLSRVAIASLLAILEVITVDIESRTIISNNFKNTNNVMQKKTCKLHVTITLRISLHEIFR